MPILGFRTLIFKSLRFSSKAFFIAEITNFSILLLNKEAQSL